MVEMKVSERNAISYEIFMNNYEVVDPKESFPDTRNLKLKIETINREITHLKEVIDMVDSYGDHIDFHKLPKKAIKPTSPLSPPIMLYDTTDPFI